MGSPLIKRYEKIHQMMIKYIQKSRSDWLSCNWSNYLCHSNSVLCSFRATSKDILNKNFYRTQHLFGLFLCYIAEYQSTEEAYESNWTLKSKSVIVICEYFPLADQEWSKKSGWFWVIQLCPYKSIQSRFNHTLQFFASTLLHTVNYRALLTDINISNPSFPWAFPPSLQVRPASLIQMISILVYIPSLMQTSCNM